MQAVRASGLMGSNGAGRNAGVSNNTSGFSGVRSLLRNAYRKVRSALFEQRRRTDGNRSRVDPENEAEVEKLCKIPLAPMYEKPVHDTTDSNEEGTDSEFQLTECERAHGLDGEAMDDDHL